MRHAAASAILVGTGTGATGWCRSAWLERHSDLPLPGPTQPALCWFTREAWPSPATAITRTEGFLTGASALTVISESEGLVAFGDGIETDALTLSGGQQVTIHAAEHRLQLLRQPAFDGLMRHAARPGSGVILILRGSARIRQAARQRWAGQVT